MLVYPEGQLATLERAECVLTTRWHVAPMLVYPDGQSATRDAWAVVLVGSISHVGGCRVVAAKAQAATGFLYRMLDWLSQAPLVLIVPMYL